MDYSSFELSFYCYQHSTNGFFNDFKQNIEDSNYIYSYTMDFLLQKKVYISELKSFQELLNDRKFHICELTDNVDFYISYVDDRGIYNLDICHSDSYSDEEKSIKYDVSIALIRAITQRPIILHYEFCNTIRLLNFKFLNFLFY